MNRKTERLLKKSLLLFLFLLTSMGTLIAQKKISMVGYLSDMQAFYQIADTWLWENTFMNRLNFTYYPNSWLTATLQFRSRVITGNTLIQIPGYNDALGKDPGWLDMTLLSSGNLGKVQDMPSLQRWIGCGCSFPSETWRSKQDGNESTGAKPWSGIPMTSLTPTPISKWITRSDREAMPSGSSTIPENASTLELAAKIDSANRVTAAAYFRFNTLGFDIQFLGGVYQGEDLVLGTGWSGNLGPVSFRGEMSYFRDLDQFRDTTGYLMASAGFDYTFSNSLMIQVEGLYSGFAKEMDSGSFLQLYSGNLDVKNLGFTEWSFFANISYPITPLFTGSFATIWYPERKGAYLGPSLDLSIKDNLVLSLILQYFTAEFDKPSGVISRESNTFGFLRLKWNF